MGLENRRETQDRDRISVSIFVKTIWLGIWLTLCYTTNSSSLCSQIYENRLGVIHLMYRFKSLILPSCMVQKSNFEWINKIDPSSVCNLEMWEKYFFDLAFMHSRELSLSGEHKHEKTQVTVNWS